MKIDMHSHVIPQTLVDAMAAAPAAFETRRLSSAAEKVYGQSMQVGISPPLGPAKAGASQ